MQDGEDVVKQVLYVGVETVEIALRGGGQVGAALYSTDSEAVVTEVGGKHVGTALNQMQTCHLSRDTCLWLCHVFPEMRNGGQPYIPSNTCGR